MEEKNLKKTLKKYFKEIHKVYISNRFREESFYPYLKTLIEECTKPSKYKANILVQPKKTEVGIPDFLIRTDGKIIGYIEAKTPDEDLQNIEDSDQLKRYRNSLPNLILTNFLEFRLFRHGNFLEKVNIGRRVILQKLQYPPVPENLEEFSQFLEKFFSFSTPEIQKSSELSIELAKRTLFLEHILQEELSRENKEITRFYKAFQEELIETLTKERFADLYSQTITYGLFAARMKALSVGTFNREMAWQFIPQSLPLLREIFYSFTGPHFPESLGWIVDEISQVLEKADIASILKEFRVTRWEDDPVIHFYETFLATYNPKERERLGVYYTPLPIVSYITKSVHRLLKDRFKKPEGLATRDVTILDPAAGTLTFVVQAIKQVKNELEKRKKQGLIQSYIREHIIPNFRAFEILMAPYTVGHFKVSMILKDLGYIFKENERFQFYLTNTLEIKEPKQISFLIDLAREGQEAKKIKEEIPILVVLGNPPYSVSSENKSEFIEKLMDDYKEDVRSEKNIQPLSDDYIKFIRFAHWKIDQAGNGILAFITNNSYLSGVIHRGMRRKLLEAFDEIYIFNLHGSSRIGEKTPEGGKDENVFDIQQGVTIALYAKHEKPLKEKKIYYTDLWGMRKKKYDYLLKHDIKTTKWQKLKPREPYYFFVPKDFALEEEYEKFWKITNILENFKTGAATHRDHFVVGFTNTELVQRLGVFTGPLSDETIQKTLKLKDTRDWSLRESRKKAKKENLKEKIIPYAYRAFDIRLICYSNLLIEFDRYDLMKHFIEKNIGLVTTKILSRLPFRHVFVTDHIGDNSFISNRTKEKNYFFPLYLYPDKTKERIFRQEEFEEDRIPNFNSDFLQSLKECLGKEPIPEDIFYYIYAVLYSPAYRKRYEEFLKIDFPRIPLPKDYKLFKTKSHLGKELVDFHLLRHPSLNKTEIGFPESGTDIVEKVIYDEKFQRIYINKNQYFEDIPDEVWHYRIGSYQVMDKYLKDRKGRKLSLDEISHYMKVEKAIRSTIKIQKKIDKG
jgi:hypothetical protein